jgi:hypothetical protein
MSSQADVRSIDSLKEFRVALALFSEDAMAALGAVDTEVRRTVQWLKHDRREYWQNQIKRRREQVSSARAEVFRRKLAKTDDYSPAMSEQKELLRNAEAGLQDAETRLGLVKKWEPALQQAALEYRAATRRIKTIASGDIPRAKALLDRLIDALEAYLRVAVPTGSPAGPPLASIADDYLRDDPGPPAVADTDTDADDLMADAAAPESTDPPA